MKLFHTYGMNYQRITVNLPKYLYEDLISLVGKGNVSSFISEATQKRLLQKKTRPEDAVSQFLALRKIAPRRTIKQILDGIHKGRT